MIRIQYEPEKTAYDGSSNVVTFTFELIGLQALEVWYEGPGTPPDDFRRQLVAPQYYTAIFGSKPPLYRGGTITLTGEVPDWVDTISIERNTPIVQLMDFSNFDYRPFYMDSIEFSADILTMIIQELAERKCNVGIVGLIDQLLSIDAYKPLYKSSLDYMLDKLTAYCLEMDTNGDDCSSNPTGTGIFDTGDNNGGLDFGWSKWYPDWAW